MAGETVAPPTGTPTGAVPAPAIVPPATPGATTAPAAPATPDVQERNGQVQLLSSKTFARIKQEARERGRKEAVNELVSELGFQSIEELKASLKGGGRGDGRGDRRHDRNRQPGQHAAQPTGQPPVAPTPPQRGSDREEWRRYERARQQFEKEREQYKRRIAVESNQRRELQRLLDAREAEMQLREAAVMVGIKDVDYAVRLLTRSLEGKSEEEIKAFDEKKYFEGLRTTHPYLFGEMVVPATTGTAGAAPAPKPPGATTAAAAAGAQFDAMAEEERERIVDAGGGKSVRILEKVKANVNDRLRKLGLNPIGS